MNAIVREKIEAYLKKAGSFKITRKEVWVAGKVPNQRVVDLSVAPPWCGVSTGTQRIESENCGIIAVQELKRDILNIYENNIKKPAERKTSPSDHQEGAPPKPVMSEQAAVQPAPAGESHPFICYACETSITAEQRSSSFKVYGRPLCEKCIVALPEPKKEQLAPKEKYPLDTVVHLNDDTNALCGYKHSKEDGRLILCLLSADVTCPQCLEIIRLKSKGEVKKREEKKPRLKKEENQC